MIGRRHRHLRSLAPTIGLAFDDEFIGRALDAVNRGLGEKRIGELGEELARVAVGRDHRGAVLVSLDGQLVEQVRVGDVEWVTSSGCRAKSSCADPIEMSHCQGESRCSRMERGRPMKQKHHTPEQIIRKLAEGDKLVNQGEDLAEVCRRLEIAESTWHRWKACGFR